MEQSKDDPKGQESYIDQEKEKKIQAEIDAQEREGEEEQEEVPCFYKFKDQNFGRPTKYREDMPERLWNYFMKPRMAKKYYKSTYHGREIKKVRYQPEEFPTIEGFLLQEGISDTTFYNWCEAHEDFLGTYKQCRKRQKYLLTQNILDGNWAVQAGTLMAVNYSDIIPPNALGDENFGGSSEDTPERVKGYDLAQIDQYCEPIEAEFSEVEK